MLRLVLCAFLLTTSGALASTFTVDAKANGAFGIDTLPTTIQSLVAGPTLTAGQRVLLSASGTINGDVTEPTPLLSGPDGINFTFLPNLFLTPLDEAAGLSFSSTISDGLALMALFLPDSSLPILNPFSSARGGDLSASDLFFVGSNLSFTAPDTGQLFFGINDLRPDNNSGAYLVTVSQVPLPAGFLLLLGGLAMLRLQKRRQITA